MKAWTNPEVIDLKISLTAGYYGGIIRNVSTGNPSYHEPTPSPVVSTTPVPSLNPSSILTE